jgi:DNA-binding transcriptional LysR family regulator
MKILYLNHSVVRSGTYVRAAQLARQVAAAGHAVTLVTTRLAASELSWSSVAGRLLSFYDEWRCVPVATGADAPRGNVP